MPKLGKTTTVMTSSPIRTWYGGQLYNRQQTRLASVQKHNPSSYAATSIDNNKRRFYVFTLKRQLTSPHLPNSVINQMLGINCVVSRRHRVIFLSANQITVFSAPTVCLIVSAVFKRNLSAQKEFSRICFHAGRSLQQTSYFAYIMSCGEISGGILNPDLCWYFTRWATGG